MITFLEENAKYLDQIYIPENLMDRIFGKNHKEKTTFDRNLGNRLFFKEKDRYYYLKFITTKYEEIACVVYGKKNHYTDKYTYVFEVSEYDLPYLQEFSMRNSSISREILNDKHYRIRFLFKKNH